MSSPDILTKSKTAVEIYEKEYNEVMKAFVKATKEHDPTTQGTAIVFAFTRLFDVTSKLLEAYRGYTKELEKLV